MRRKLRLGLALGSGSSRGWAHIGVIRALEERGVKPDIICGTSIGALVGAAYAAGELDKLEEWVTGIAWTTVVRLMDLTWRGGLIRGTRLFTLFGTLFGERDIDDLPIPYGAIATELQSGREHRVAVGCALRDMLRGDARACARAVFDHDGLAERSSERFLKSARHEVRRAAGGESDHQANRLFILGIFGMQKMV